MNEQDKLYLELGAKDNITPVLEKIKKESEELEEQFSNFKAITIKDIVLKTDGALDTIRKQIQEGLNVKPFTIDVEASPNVDTSKITDAVRTIIEAQERLVNGASVNVGGSTADTSGASQQNTQAARENAEAVNQQAKSYEELKAQVDAVLGSIQANTATIVEQKNAISLIDKEMRAINKDVEKSGTMTDTQRKRLEMLTASREQHKQSLQSSMRILQNDIKLGMAATGSMDELSQSLGRMRKAYRAMTEEQRNGSFGKDLLASIQTADAKIKELDASIGNHQRNVGNYGSAFNGLNMSVQQVVRELPSATMGLQMFFLAISNNLPILADQIKMAKEANKAMKEMGQDTTPVWKQLVKSLFSWQTAMIVGITLLTVYGKEIAAWTKELFTGQRAAISTAEATEKLNEALEKNDGKFSDNAMNVKRLADEWKGLKTEAEQTAWIDRNQSAFEQMGLSIRDVTSAERAFVEYTPAVIEALKSRARAEAARELAREKYKEAFLKREKARQEEEKGVSAWDRMRGSLAMTSSVSVPSPNNGRDQNTIANSLHDERVKSLHDEADTLEEEVNTFYDIAKLEDEKSKAELKRLGLLKEQGKTHKEQLQAQKANLQAQLDVLSESEAAGATGNALRKQIEAVDKRLAAYSLTATNRNNRKGLTDAARAEREAVKAGEAAEKRAGILTRQAVEVERVAKDTELSTRAAEIGAMEESTEKALQQIELDKERKLEAIRREYEDLKLKRIEEAKKLWDADPKNKGVNFYESDSYKTAASDSQYTQAERDNRIAREKEIEASTIRAMQKANNDKRRIMYDYLREYGSIQDKRKAINDDYNERIARANDEWEKARLRAERDKMISETNLKELQLSIDWEDVFSDIDKHSVKFLEEIKTRLQAALNTKDITAENAKVLAEKIRDIETTIAGKTSIWQEILPGLRERKRLTEQAAAAETEYQKALEKEAEAFNRVIATKQAIKEQLDKLDIRNELGEKITIELEAINEENKDNLLASLQKGSDLYNSLLKLFENLAADTAEANQANETTTTKRGRAKELKDSLNSGNVKSLFNDLFNFKGMSFTELADLVDVNVQSMADFVDKIGLEGTDFGDAVHGFAEGVGGFNSAIKSLASGDVFGAINGVLDGIAGFGKSGINLFAGSGNTEEMEAEIEELARANEHLSKSIDSLAETIRSNDSTNSESEEAYKRALAAEKEWEQNQRQAIRDRAGEWSNSGHGLLGLGGKSSFNYYLDNKGTLFQKWNGWDEFNKVLKQFGYNTRVSSSGDLWQLTPEQMQLLRDYAPRAWAELLNTDGESNPSDLLNAYIERAGKIDELTSALNEKLTGYSWDSFKGSYVDTLKDLTSTTENFADNIEDLLTNAILNSLVNEAYKERIQKLYKMIADAASDESDGGSSFTSLELQRIRDYNEKLANDLVTARDALVQSGAIRETGNSSSSSVGSSIKSVSEQTADVLASYINAIRATSALNQQTLVQIATHIQQQMTPIAQAQLQQLQSLVQSNNLIEANTKRNAQLVEHIDDILRRVINGADKLHIK